jgi:hypothetical protein
MLRLLLAMSLASVEASATKVFFLLGQSNMEGQGIVEEADGAGSGNGTLAFAVKNRPSTGLPAYDPMDAAAHREGCVAKRANLESLKLEDGSWAKWPNVQVDYFGKVGNGWGMVHPRGPLSVGFGVSDKRGVGPELGIGVELAKHYGNTTHVLLLKVAWGGTSLAKDWRPPSSVSEFGGALGWCYTNFTAHAHTVLNELDSYEIAGMVWHQGWNDGCSYDMVVEYERNLANLIRDVRSEFAVPKLPVSIPVSGMDSFRGRVDRRNGIIHAQYAVTQYPENVGTVGAQETRGFVRFFDETGGACNQGYHYNWCMAMPDMIQTVTVPRAVSSHFHALVVPFFTDCPPRAVPYSNGESYFYVGSVAGQSMSGLLDGTWKQPYINTTNPSDAVAELMPSGEGAVVEDGCEVYRNA